MNVPKLEFIEFLDSVIGKIYADDQAQLTVYKLEKNDVFDNLSKSGTIGTEKLTPGMGFAESLSASLECLSVMASTFHIWHFIHEQRLKKQHEAVTITQDERIEKVKSEWVKALIENGVAEDVAENIANNFSDSLDRIIS